MNACIPFPRASVLRRIVREPNEKLGKAAGMIAAAERNGVRRGLGLLGCGLAVAAAWGTAWTAIGQEPAPPAVRAPEVVRPAAKRLAPDPRRDTEAKIFAALDAVGDEDWLETPLEELSAKLEAKYAIRVALDRDALDAEGLSGETPVSIKAKGVRLGDALRQGLNAVHVDFGLRPSFLVLTSESAASQRKYLVVRVYEVSDLLVEQTASGPREVDPQQLASLVKTSIDPAAWDDQGGESSLQVFSVEKAVTLVTTGALTTQESVRRLLADLRAARDSIPAGGGRPVPVDPAKIIP